MLADGSDGSWSCKNAWADALKPGDLGAMAGCRYFLKLCGFFVWDRG